MGVDFYACNYCGDTFPDCGSYIGCECGEKWCCYECSKAEGHRFSVLVDEDGDEVEESNCNFCRQEDFSDSELLEFLIGSHNSSRAEVISMYKEWLEEEEREEGE